MDIKNTIENILNRTELSLDGEVISKEKLLESFYSFLASTGNHPEHNVGIVEHTGSICFDVMALWYATVSILLNETFNPEEIVSSLRNEDRVLFREGSKQEIFYFEGCGIDSRTGKEAVFLRKGTKTYSIPRPLWNDITPYNGGAKVETSGKGLKRVNLVRDAFFMDVLGYEKGKIPTVFTKSVVILLPRERADEIIKGLTIRFGENQAKITDLIPISYYTENDEYQYAGNSEKNEPAIKVTSRITKAYDLVVRGSSNPCFGVILCGNEWISSAPSYVQQILKRNDLRFVFCLMDMLFDKINELIKMAGVEPALFACTKEALLPFEEETAGGQYYIKELRAQREKIVRNEKKICVLEGVLSWEEYSTLIYYLISIKNTSFVSERKDQFIINSFSLIKLFSTAPFSMEEYDRWALSEGAVLSTSKDQIELIKECVKDLPEDVKSETEYIVTAIDILYEALENITKKKEVLLDYLNNKEWRSMAVVVPKARYCNLLADMYWSSITRGTKKHLDFATPNSFDKTSQYDYVLVFGNYSGKSFDALRCFNTSNLVSVLYEYEEKVYNYRHACYQRDVNGLNRQNWLNSECVEEVGEAKDVAAFVDLDQQLNSFVAQISERELTASIPQAGQTSVPSVDIVAAGRFETGEKIYFTKYYEAYVYNDTKQTIDEVSVDKLNEGDTLVFMQNDRDVVTAILEAFIANQDGTNDIVKQYELSKKWKTALRDYMIQHGESVNEIADALIKNGIKVGNATIRGWLDEGSHTVGPRDPESIMQIAYFVGDEEMLSNTQTIFNACSIIRRLRGEILSEMGQFVRNKLIGKASSTGIYSKVLEHFDSIVQLLKIEKIVKTQTRVPINYTNRPIED